MHKSRQFRTKESWLLPKLHAKPPQVWTSGSERDTEKLKLFIRVKIQYDRKKLTKAWRKYSKICFNCLEDCKVDEDRAVCRSKRLMWNQQRQGWGGAREEVYRGGIQIRFTSQVSTSRIGLPAWPHPLLSSILVDMMAWGWEEGKEEERMKGVRGKERDKRRRRGRKGLEFWVKDSGFYHRCRSSSPPTAGNDTSLAQHPSLHPILQGNEPGF